MRRSFIFIIVVTAFSVSVFAKKKYMITTSGETLRALTQITDSKYACITPFGGDFGKDLYYAVNEDGKYYNIFKKENVGASATQQKTAGKNFNYSPSYCAETDKVAFRCMNEGMSQSDIYIFSNNKGKALTQVTETNQANEGNPCINQDGNMLVYDRQNYITYKQLSGLSFLLGTANVVIIEKSEIWVKNLQNGENTLLGNGYQPQFSPDGSKIAYVKYSSDAKSCNIWVMDSDGSNQVQITDAKKGYAFYPRWNPKGDKLVFQLIKKDKKDSDIYTIDIDGNNLTQLTVNKSHDGTPYWTKDNNIYFVSDRGNEPGKYQIWRFKVED